MYEYIYRAGAPLGSPMSFQARTLLNHDSSSKQTPNDNKQYQPKSRECLL